ncbi:pyridoxamine 5'-phosphate oxidase [Aureimonas leprariae]|uniref:Pyridoxine/pyridoxamine 5'-phosphate oxidase n=1 Tax=Plantimonas leprariae TaxID=2615207 RepID=A0A7V7TW49_9HYPH|nr:pyridoxamine 5'-phosphate oxidase [Aureimonas leprariae]KAB0679588.1 pyridoxamine 5'-phosphate oxidase [Aureimonas leprariae]
MTNESLTLGETLAGDDPIGLFADWLHDAEASEPNDPGAVALATVDASGLPDVRMVLLKGYDARGFVFYTNFESAKGTEILANRKAAMCFHWKTLRRQVRLRGPVEVVTQAEADAYFASRPRGSRLGAWASQQSRPLESRKVLADAVDEVDRRHPGEDVPRPPNWSGFRIVPGEIEFWKDGASRLHDRILYKGGRGGEGWERTRLYP